MTRFTDSPFILIFFDLLGIAKQSTGEWGTREGWRANLSVVLDDRDLYVHIFDAMPKMIDGVAYYSASEVAEQAGVHRLTLIRWIREGKLADAPRDRNGWRVFSEKLAEQISTYAKSFDAKASPNQGILFPRTNLNTTPTEQPSRATK